MNGLDRSSTEPRIKFKNAKARELQLSKERFGKGDWKFSIEIRAIKGRDGKLYKANFPDDWRVSSQGTKVDLRDHNRTHEIRDVAAA